jgi:hypothetical protein
MGLAMYVRSSSICTTRITHIPKLSPSHLPTLFPTISRHQLPATRTIYHRPPPARALLPSVHTPTPGPKPNPPTHRQAILTSTHHSIHPLTPTSTPSTGPPHHQSHHRTFLTHNVHDAHHLAAPPATHGDPRILTIRPKAQRRQQLRSAVWMAVWRQAGGEV